MEKLVGVDFIQVGKRYKVLHREFNCSEEKFHCKVVDAYPNFYVISVDGKRITVMKNKIICKVYKFYLCMKKERQ